MKKLSVLFCCAFIIGLFAGCESATESPSDVVNQYHQAIWDKNIDAVMEHTAPEVNRSVVESLLEFRSDGMKRSGGLPVIVSEEIDGDKAVVRCKFGPVEQDVNLRKVDEAWKVE